MRSITFNSLVYVSFFSHLLNMWRFPPKPCYTRVSFSLMVSRGVGSFDCKRKLSVQFGDLAHCSLLLQWPGQRREVLKPAISGSHYVHWKGATTIGFLWAFSPLASGCSKITPLWHSTSTGWWFGTWILFFHMGISSSQLTFTPSFFRGVGLNHQPA